MTKNRAKLLKGEKLLLFLIIFFGLLNLVGPYFSMARLSDSNIKLESIKNKIKKQDKLNEGLTMKINELASLDYIDQVATNYGLGYNNNNVKKITE
jgi:cell division protein FtsL